MSQGGAHAGTAAAVESSSGWRRAVDDAKCGRPSRFIATRLPRQDRRSAAARSQRDAPTRARFSRALCRVRKLASADAPPIAVRWTRERGASRFKADKPGMASRSAARRCGSENPGGRLWHRFPEGSMLWNVSSEGAIAEGGGALRPRWSGRKKRVSQETASGSCSPRVAQTRDYTRKIKRDCDNSILY